MSVFQVVPVMSARCRSFSGRPPASRGVHHCSCCLHDTAPVGKYISPSRAVSCVVPALAAHAAAPVVVYILPAPIVYAAREGHLFTDGTTVGALNVDITGFQMKSRAFAAHSKFDLQLLAVTFTENPEQLVANRHVPLGRKDS